MILKIGDTGSNDLVQVTDRSYDGPGSTRITVRELIGGYETWHGGRTRAIRSMRHTALRSSPYPISRSRLVSEFYHGGCNHATFIVYAPGGHA